MMCVDYSSVTGQNPPTKSVPLSLSLQSKQQRHSGSYQRQSVHNTFSVATSASGMPVLDSEPVDRKRSVALREVSGSFLANSLVHNMTLERS